MKLEDYKNLNLRHLSGKELKKAHGWLKGKYTKAEKTFDKQKLKPEPLRISKKEMGYAKRVKDPEKRMKREIAAMRDFYFTKVPGNKERTRTMTSTIAGYKAVLKDTGRVLNIKGYEKWSEKQRKDLWKIIDSVREQREQYFKDKDYADVMYQSGTSFKTITFMIQELGMYDPVDILEQLEKKIQLAEAGRKMSNEEFFGFK